MRISGDNRVEIHVAHRRFYLAAATSANGEPTFRRWFPGLQCAIMLGESLLILSAMAMFRTAS